MPWLVPAPGRGTAGIAAVMSDRFRGIGVLVCAVAGFGGADADPGSRRVTAPMQVRGVLVRLMRRSSSRMPASTRTSSASQVTARHPNHEKAAALALPSDAAVLVSEDIYEDLRGSPVDFTRTV